ncbi:MAG: T9SS C-terminal target domain-containing protein, partial [Calditrichaeota bacterium]
IVYSTSENREGAGTGMSGSEFAARALKTCSTIQQFRDLLNATDGKRRVHEHYAIIDSSGSGSMFEVDGYTWVEIAIVDSIGTMANTAKYHPSAGPPVNKSTSPDREARAEYLLTHGPENGLNYHYFVQDIIKDYCRTQLDEDFMPIGQYYTNPVLSRYKTAIGGVIRGVIPGDNPEIMASMWLCLSEPSLSVALPFFNNTGEVPDFIRSFAQGQGMAGSSDRVRQLIYDYTHGRYFDYFADTFVLVDVQSQTAVIQDSLFKSYEENLPSWLAVSPEVAATQMHDWMFAMHQWAKGMYDAIPRLLSVTEQNDTPVETMQLRQNYPNPFRDQTTISFNLEKQTPVSIIVYNILGEKVKNFEFQQLTPGIHEIDFYPLTTVSSRLPAGIYFYKLISGKNIKIRKMVLLP